MKRIFLLQLLLSAAVLAEVVRAQDTNYVTRSDLAAYAPLSALDDYATTASLAGYVLLSDLYAYATLSDLAGFVSATILTNYPTRSDLAAYATAADLAGLATTASLSSYALLSDLSAYATSSDLDDYATTADLAAYATTANLAAATAAASNALAAATASASNSFLHASPYPNGQMDFWRVHAPAEFTRDTLFDALATFEENANFNDLASFTDGIALRGSTRIRWTDLQSRTVTNGTLTATADDCIIWTDPGADECLVYLPAEANDPNHTRTIVVRDHAGPDANTSVYFGTTNSSTLLLTLTETNQTAVFDWCPPLQTWLPR